MDQTVLKWGHIKERVLFKKNISRKKIPFLWNHCFVNVLRDKITNGKIGSSLDMSTSLQ